MHHTLTDIARVIQRHREAVLADEASFTDDGVALSQAQAAITGAAEVAAFRAFVSVQCETSADANRKLDYLLNGTIGERDRLPLRPAPLSGRRVQPGRGVPAEPDAPGRPERGLPRATRQRPGGPARITPLAVVFRPVRHG